MFAYDTVIDTVQNGQKEFVKMTVKNEKIADAINEFVDAQTEYVKGVVEAGIETSKAISSEMVNIATTPAKFDHESMIKTMTDMFKTMVPTAK